MAKMKSVSPEDIGNYTFSWLKDGIALKDHENRLGDFVEDIWLPIQNKVLINGILLKIGDIQVCWC